MVAYLRSLPPSSMNARHRHVAPGAAAGRCIASSAPSATTVGAASCRLATRHSSTDLLQRLPAGTEAGHCQRGRPAPPQREERGAPPQTQRVSLYCTSARGGMGLAQAWPICQTLWSPRRHNQPPANSRICHACGGSLAARSSLMPPWRPPQLPPPSHHQPRGPCRHTHTHTATPRPTHLPQPSSEHKHTMPWSPPTNRHCRCGARARRSNCIGHGGLTTPAQGRAATTLNRAVPPRAQLASFGSISQSPAAPSTLWRWPVSPATPHTIMAPRSCPVATSASPIAATAVTSSAVTDESSNVGGAAVTSHRHSSSSTNRCGTSGMRPHAVSSDVALGRPVAGAVASAIVLAYRTGTTPPAAAAV